jgi:anti-sigma B factor antagonist
MSEKHHGSHWLEREDVGAITVARLKTGKVLDEDVVRTVFGQVSSLVTEVGRSRLVLNLAAVGYLPSVALGKLVLLNRQAEAAGGRLALCCLAPTVQEILDTSRLADMFNLYATEEEAVQSFS